MFSGIPGNQPTQQGKIAHYKKHNNPNDVITWWNWHVLNQIRDSIDLSFIVNDFH